MLMAQAAWGQSTGYSTPEDNVIEQRMPDVPLEQGQLRFSVLPGYRDEVNNLHYAFPVGNSALGRTWATGRDLSWQVANGYSVVPVLVEFEHRMASAQQVRVEVITTRPYAREELQAYGGDSAEDLSSQLAVFSGEMLVPPSVPSSFVLTPRYIPDVPPGTAVYMQVYIYFNNSPVPTWSRKLDVVVLNPAHLYFLHLDAEPGQPEELVVNPANQLRLGKLAEPGFDPSVLSSLLYGMPVDRRVVTGAPLAARDFAFVCADARQVRDWPQEEQDALEGFMLGGGRLCLYNMQGSWRGYAGHDSPVGRGFLLAQAGDYQAAKQQMLGWLEGELEEFVLLAGGSVRGYDVPSQGGNSIFGSPGLDLDQVYGTDPLAGTLPSQRPGFLHPVMLYREISSDNAIEPWDFPEYQLSRPRQTGQLTNRLALDSVLDSRQQREAALLEAAVPSRPFPLLLLAVLAVPLLAMLLLRRSRGRRQWLATAVACLMCLIAWLAGQPMEFHPVRLRLLDRDLRSDVADSRRLSVVMADSHGRSRLQMPPAALVRRVVSSPPGRDRKSVV